MSPELIGTLSVRLKPGNPDHHLYRNNGGNWWVHYTLHLPDGTAERVRRSLRTADLPEARHRRDATFKALSQMGVAA
jgi:hypothetical protein